MSHQSLSSSIVHDPHHDTQQDNSNNDSIHIVFEPIDDNNDDVEVDNDNPITIRNHHNKEDDDIIKNEDQKEQHHEQDDNNIISNALNQINDLQNNNNDSIASAHDNNNADTNNKQNNIMNERKVEMQSAMWFEPSEHQKDDDIDEQPQEQQQPKEEDGTNDKDPPSQLSLLSKRFYTFYWTNEFLILTVIVIIFAKLYPPLGAVYLAPDITATWIAVIFEFFMAGLTLQTKEFSKAFQRIQFNSTIQFFNFGIDSAVVYGVALALRSLNILSIDLTNGMIICSCLPMTVNMVCVLTSLSHGDEAAAIFNAATGNMLGVIISPLLILLYIGESANLDIGETLYELTLRVIVPCIAGQLIQYFVPPIVLYVKNHKFFFKQAQQYALVYIVYTVFCKTFSKDTNNSILDIFLMIIFQFLLLIFLMIFSWYLLKFMYPKNPKLRIMGLYGCTHKTVATGIPLINAIYGDNPAVGLFTLPLLIWHPMQLVIGTILAPRLAQYVLTEQQRLLLDENDIPLAECIEDNNNATQQQSPNTDVSIQDSSEEEGRIVVDVDETSSAPPQSTLSN